MGKKNIIIFLSVILSLILIAVTCVLVTKHDKTVIKIGDTEICESEFLMVFENEIRAQMLSKVVDKDLKNPWEYEIDGKTLKEQALKATCDKILEYVSQQRLFSEYEIFDWSYEKFKDKYSEKLSNAYSDEEIQYGTQNYTEYDYYVYLHSIYRNDVENKILNDTDEQKIYDFYVSFGDLFRDTDVYVFERYGIDKTKENAKDLIKKASKGDISPDVSVSKVTLDAYTSKYDEALELTVDLGENIYDMQYEGAEIFTENEYELLYIKTLSYKKGEIRNYKDCREIVKERFAEYSFDKEIENIKSTLKVEKTKYYNKLKLY